MTIPELQKGTLYLVPTPIGNLEDITLRALRILRECRTVFAEDTRRTAKLFAHHSITTPLRAYHAHSSDRATEHILEALERGETVALVSDAGTPLISDPGATLVREAQNIGVPVVALPGATSVTTAFVVSGVGGAGFRFAGFLPRAGQKRALALQSMRFDPMATVFFEAPSRTLATLRELTNVCGGEREIALCRELSKLHEEVFRAPLAQMLVHLEGRSEILGEVVLVLAGAVFEEELSDQEGEVDHRTWILAKRASGLSAKDVARLLHEQRGMARRDAYRTVLAVWDESPR